MVSASSFVISLCLRSPLWASCQIVVVPFSLGMVFSLFPSLNASVERWSLGRYPRLGARPHHPRHRLRGGIRGGDRSLLHVQVEAHEGAGSRCHATDHL